MFTGTGLISAIPIFALTPIEFMVIVAILGALALVAIPTFINYFRKKKETEAIDGLNKTRKGAKTIYERERAIAIAAIFLVVIMSLIAAWLLLDDSRDRTGPRWAASDTPTVSAVPPTLLSDTATPEASPTLTPTHTLTPTPTFTPTRVYIYIPPTDTPTPETISYPWVDSDQDQYPACPYDGPCDCNDQNPNINPGVQESPNTPDIDDNCNGSLEN